MTDIEVRPITDAEIADYLRSVRTAFHLGSDVTDGAVDFFRNLNGDQLDRRLGAFVNGSLCGTTGSIGVELTVPGPRTVPLAAVTQVTVLPTHRRQGLLREMMRFQIDNAIARGEIVAMLIAAEWPIYGRFGYGMAVEAASTVIDARSARFREIVAPRGALEIVDLSTLRALAPEAFDRHRRMTPGAISRPDKMWDVLSGVVVRPGEDAPKNRTRVLHRGRDGDLDGYVVYESTETWIHNRPSIKLDVLELIAVTDEAYADLWRYLCEIDWVSEINGHVRAIDEDLRQLFIDGRVARQADRSDHMWVRLLDVPAALAARRYETPVSVVLDVKDNVLGDGRFRLDGDADGATCEATDEPADVALDVEVLGAAYLGGSPLHPYAVAGRIDELTPGAVIALDRGMRTARAPWATTGF